VGDFTIIRPCDDAAATQCSDWADDLIAKLTAAGHSSSGTDIDGGATPSSTHTADVIAAFAANADLLCYFGHGDEDNWLTYSAPTLEASKMPVAGCQAVVSIACKTGCGFGPACITAGVVSWLGFTIKVGMPIPHLGTDPIGEAIVKGLELLGSSKTMQEVRDEIATQLDNVANAYDKGAFSSHPGRDFGYFAAISLRDHVVIHGSPAHVSL
jgi:hypothetical protein